MIYVMAIYSLCVGLGPRRTAGVGYATLTILFVFAGYLAAYLTTPYDLQWHISTSMDRLLLQVWPTFVLVFFLSISTPEEIFGTGRNVHRESTR